MNKHLSGQDYDFIVGGTALIAAEVSVKITDGRVVKYQRGVSVGHVGGKCEAEVTLKLDHENFLLMQAKAEKAGSWQDIKPFTISGLAQTKFGSKNIEVFGCLPMIDDLLSAKTEGGEDDTTSIKCLVTSKDFIKINGAPYLSLQSVRDL